MAANTQRKPSLVRNAGLAVLLSVLLALVVVYGCSQTGPVTKSKQLTILIGAGPSNLNPLLNFSGQSQTFWINMFDALTRFDENMKIQPALATSWKLVDDSTWEFELRPGVKFHNGEPFNAEVVKYSLERVLDPKLKR